MTGVVENVTSIKESNVSTRVSEYFCVRLAIYIETGIELSKLDRHLVNGTIMYHTKTKSYLCVHEV